MFSGNAYRTPSFSEQDVLDHGTGICLATAVDDKEVLGNEEDSVEMIGTPLPSEEVVLDQTSFLIYDAKRFADVPLSQSSFELRKCGICGEKKDKGHLCFNCYW
ncbi:hypothetical protein P5673_030353, partial [Acropora cervicornis]